MLAYDDIPAEAKALRNEGALGFVRPSLDAAAFSGRVPTVTIVLLTDGQELTRGCAVSSSHTELRNVGHVGRHVTLYLDMLTFQDP